MAIKETQFKTAYGAKMRVAIETGEGLTEQHHKDEVDVNNIVKKYNKTGLIDHVNAFEKQYADLTGYDYQTAMNTVAAANALFEQMPSKIRNKFDNDPARFLNFVDDENNAEAMVELGLAVKKPEERKNSEFVPPVDNGSTDPVQAPKGAETEAKQG